MESIVNVVLPIFAVILAGFVARKIGLFNDGASDILNRFIYYFALPVLLFHVMAKVNPEQIFYWPFIGAYFGGQVGATLLALGVFAIFFKGSMAERSIFSLSAVNGNTGYMGIPLAMTAFGTGDAVLAASIGTIINSAVVVGIAIAVIEIDLRRGIGFFGVARDTLIAVLKNPLFMPSMAGIAWSFTGIALPDPVDAFCSLAGGAAPTAGLFTIGLFLAGRPVRGNMGEVATMVIAKLIIHPLVTGIFVFYIFDMPPVWAALAVLIAALPMGANGFVIALKYGIYAERSSAGIMISTALSLVTLSLLFSYWDVILTF